MKKIISKVQYYFEKIKSNKRLMYMFCTTILVLFCLALNIAFSAFSQTTINAAANIKVKNMEYSMIINGTAGTIITGTPNDITKSNVMITALNSRSSKYELYYHICSDSNCTEYITKPDGLTIEYSSRTTDPVTGSIEATGGKTIRVVTTNTTSTTYYIKLDINAGYSYNTLALKNLITSEYDEDDVTIAAYIDGTLSTTFPTTSAYTSSVTCMVRGNSSNANALSLWDGKKWIINIIGADTGETRCNVYFVAKADTSGANEPLLATNMIPVYYDNTEDVWKKADVSNTNGTWYNYTSQIWANAVTVTSTTRTTYNSAAVGTSISMSDILGMWVWIPRFEFMTTNLGTSYAGGTQSLPGGISIKFISGTNTTADTNYMIHPVFRNGSTSYTLPNSSTASNYSQGGWDKEITGFWIGKFETGYATNFSASHTAESSNILIKPDVYSMYYQTVSSEYTTAQNVQNDHGIGSTMETHMTKNDEWGAVAYLTQSEYGKYGNTNYTGANKEVYANNSGDTTNYYYTTGRSNGTYGSTSAAMTNYGTYEYNNCPATNYLHTSCTETVRNTNATLGTGASTTGNIYGVYDMVGGVYEFLMLNYNGNLGSSGFSSLPSQKYYNKFTSTSLSSLCNGTQCYGQALSNDMGTGSVSGAYMWYNDIITLPSFLYYWGIRGCNSNGVNNTNTGILCLGNSNGGAFVAIGFRVTIT